MLDMGYPSFSYKSEAGNFLLFLTCLGQHPILKQIEVYDGSDGGTGSSAEVPQDTQHKASGPADIVEILYNRTATWQVTRVCLSHERPEIWDVDSHDFS